MELANEQSVLDAISCTLFKHLLPVFILSLNVIINELREGFILTVIKMALITPVLKSKQLDSDILNNYRLVSNLTTLPKVFEKRILKLATSKK